MENKQHAMEQPVGQRRNHKRNKKIPKTSENGNKTHQNLWNTAKSSSKKEVYSNKHLPQDMRKITNKQPNTTPRGIRKKKNEVQVSRRKEIKNRAEMNEIETKKTV